MVAMEGLVGYMPNSQSPCGPCSWPISISISTDDPARGRLTLIAFSLHAQNLAATLCLMHGWTGDRGEGYRPIRWWALGRCVAIVLLSVRVDVRRGAAAHYVRSYCTTTSSTSTTSTTHVPPSLPLRRVLGRYNLWSSTYQRSCFYAVNNLC
jgi:hypothetical protein